MSIYFLDNLSVQKEVFDIERDDPSLNGEKSGSLTVRYHLTQDGLNKIFLSHSNIAYVTDYILAKKSPFRIVTHPHKTNTCYEKAQMLGNWNPLNVVKALYFECPIEQHLYAVVVPETGCFIDRSYLSSLLMLPKGITLAKAKELPVNMSYGTCSPFITSSDLIENGGKVAKILFDSEALVAKKHDDTLDDFSFGLDHRFSLQMNYYYCYKMLKAVFGNSIIAEDVLTLSFTEKFIRKKGKIRVNYDFKSINYRTAKFINSIHGTGDVSVENDYIDELDLPEILTSS